MYSFPVIHESRDLKQARPCGQYVDLLRLCAHYSLTDLIQFWDIIAHFFSFVNSCQRFFASQKEPAHTEICSFALRQQVSECSVNINLQYPVFHTQHLLPRPKLPSQPDR